MAKRGICFDLDGTLIDSGPGGLMQFCKVAKNLNLPISEKIETGLKAMWGPAPLQSYQYCLAWYGHRTILQAVGGSRYCRTLARFSWNKGSSYKALFQPFLFKHLNQ